MSPKLERLAAQLAALSDKDRHDTLVLADELTGRVRAVGRRLKGRGSGTWGDLMVGGIIYDKHGTAVGYIKKMVMVDSVDGNSVVEIEAVDYL